MVGFGVCVVVKLVICWNVEVLEVDEGYNEILLCKIMEEVLIYEGEIIVWCVMVGDEERNVV